MLNEEKIRLMTRLALYEQKEGKKDLPLGKYYRTDYLTLKMINSAIVMTAGYIVLLATIALINIEQILSDLVTMDMVTLGRNILIIYVILFTLNMLATYFIASQTFKRSRKNLKRYNAMLKELYLMYKKEGKGSENGFFGEDFVTEMPDVYETADFGGINDDEIIDD